MRDRGGGQSRRMHAERAQRRGRKNVRLEYFQIFNEASQVARRWSRCHYAKSIEAIYALRKAFARKRFARSGRSSASPRNNPSECFGK